MDELYFEGDEFFLSPEELSPALKTALKACSTPGPSHEEVAYVLDTFDVTCDEDLAVKYLLSYGAWDEGELDDHRENLGKLVWLAACDMRESGEINFSIYG